MADISALLSQIRQSFLQELTPSPAQKMSEVQKNGFGQPSFGSGNLVIGYSVNATPLVMRVSGSNEDLGVFSSQHIDHVRIVNVGDVAQAQKLAEVLETLFGTSIVLDEPKRRIRRFAASPARSSDIPEGFVRDPRTGEIRPKRRAGRKPAVQTEVV